MTKNAGVCQISRPRTNIFKKYKKDLRQHKEIETPSINTTVCFSLHLDNDRLLFATFFCDPGARKPSTTHVAIGFVAKSFLSAKTLYLPFRPYNPITFD